MKKKILLAISGLLGITIVVMISMYFVTGINVKSNIKHCQEIFPDTPENALIAYMLDETKHPETRSHVAIWTLAQIRSEKAQPYLQDLYQDDPKGKTCADKHDTELCQYEIYKAIKSVEKGGLFSYEKHK